MLRAQGCTGNASMKQVHSLLLLGVKQMVDLLDEGVSKEEAGFGMP